MEDIEQYVEESIPLTKPKKLVKQLASKPKEPIETSIQQAVIPPVKKKRVMTKPKTQKQLEAFERARLKRQENAMKRQKEKELHYAKMLAEHKESQQLEQPTIKQPVKRVPKQTVIYEDESESETEVIYVKRPSKRKPKKKVIVKSSSESESSDEESDKHVSIQRQPSYQQPVYNVDDYFA